MENKTRLIKIASEERKNIYKGVDVKNLEQLKSIIQTLETNLRNSEFMKGLAPLIANMLYYNETRRRA